ncbi:bifunctional DNA primase/polymerase [Streptomyces sp. NPDC050418]|uniref:bifunctional DNA primase/polymerase n=1 Tax=Streptomyces sp. NPDC050418 TaxID=3365612 RepID=UPI0037B45083
MSTTEQLTNTNLIPHAVGALHQGLSIFPVQPNEKTPHLIRPDKPYSIRWSEWATRDLNRVIAAWSYSPAANIGVACAPSRLLVVDCDIAKEKFALRGTPYEQLHDTLGPLVDGHDALKALCELSGGDWEELNDTYRVQTGSMGLHLYYSWPPGIRASQASPIKGLVDVRGNGGTQGGYVLGAGSVTTKGRYIAENATPVRPAPRWLVEMVREKPAPKRPLLVQPRRSGGISGLVDTVATAPDGNLGNALFWAARSACSDGIAIEEAINQLGAAYVAAHGRGGHRQAEASVRSAYRNQSRKEGIGNLKSRSEARRWLVTQTSLRTLCAAWNWRRNARSPGGSPHSLHSGRSACSLSKVPGGSMRTGSTRTCPQRQA